MATERPRRLRFNQNPCRSIAALTCWDTKETRNDAGQRINTHEQRTYPGVRYLGLSKPVLTVDVPYAYVVPAALENVIANLTSHGVALQRISSEARRRSTTIPDY